MKQWKVLHTEPASSIEEIISILLKNRNVSDSQKKDFLSPSLKKVDIHSVGISPNEVQKALEKIKTVIDSQKAIVIYGDYDVDGICGTAILWETIYAFYTNVHPYIPHRVNEGYGLSEEGIKNIQKTIENVGLIITVDNGIVAKNAADFANENNIDVIITDHHVRGKILPVVHAIIHTTELCGTAVAYLFAQEISKEFNSIQNKSHLELVSLATVADLVPLNISNRALLKSGLENLRVTKRIGLLALFSEAVIKKEEVDVYHLGHIIAPRLNAAGRISHAMDSLRLLCTLDGKRAQKLALELGQINKERQEFTKLNSEEASQKIKTENNLENVLIVSGEEYQQGVIGLIASRLTEEFYRPSVAISIGDKISKGSARSIPGVNIIELIRSCSEFLKEAGGHPMAAGFSIETNKLGEFKKAILEKAESIDKKLFERSLKVDLEIPFVLISLELYDSLKPLEPYGMGNPEPVFMTKGVTVISVNKVGREGDHLQLVLEQDGKIFKGIKFRHMDKETIKPKTLINVCYSLDINMWGGKSKVELKIKDIVLSSAS